VPKFQLDWKKINLLSDRTRKSKLGEKWWRSEMVGAERFPTSMSIGLPGRLFIPIPRFIGAGSDLLAAYEIPNFKHQITGFQVSGVRCQGRKTKKLQPVEDPAMRGRTWLWTAPNRRRHAWA